MGVVNAGYVPSVDVSGGGKLVTLAQPDSNAANSQMRLDCLQLTISKKPQYKSLGNILKIKFSKRCIKLRAGC